MRRWRVLFTGDSGASTFTRTHFSLFALICTKHNGSGRAAAATLPLPCRDGTQVNAPIGADRLSEPGLKPSSKNADVEGAAVVAIEAGGSGFETSGSQIDAAGGLKGAMTMASMGSSGGNGGNGGRPQMEDMSGLPWWKRAAKTVCVCRAGTGRVSDCDATKHLWRQPARAVSAESYASVERSAICRCLDMAAAPAHSGLVLHH